MFAIFGTLITLGGTVLISSPDIVVLEKCFWFGRLLRGIEKLESEPVSREDTGFKELMAEINSIAQDDERLPIEVTKIDIYSSGINIGGRVTNFKVIGRYHNPDKAYQIEEPEFERIRFQIYRKIRRGKTKIRAYGIALVLFGFLIQGYNILYL